MNQAILYAVVFGSAAATFVIALVSSALVVFFILSLLSTAIGGAECFFDSSLQDDEEDMTSAVQKALDDAWWAREPSDEEIDLMLEHELALLDVLADEQTQMEVEKTNRCPKD